MSNAFLTDTVDRRHPRGFNCGDTPHNVCVLGGKKPWYHDSVVILNQDRCCFSGNSRADNSGDISKDETIAAIMDYFDDKISKDDAIEVIMAYFG